MSLGKGEWSSAKNRKCKLQPLKIRNWILLLIWHQINLKRIPILICFLDCRWDKKLKYQSRKWRDLLRRTFKSCLSTSINLKKVTKRKNWKKGGTNRKSLVEKHLRRSKNARKGNLKSEYHAQIKRQRLWLRSEKLLMQMRMSD